MVHEQDAPIRAPAWAAHHAGSAGADDDDVENMESGGEKGGRNGRRRGQRRGRILTLASRGPPPLGSGRGGGAAAGAEKIDEGRAAGRRSVRATLAREAVPCSPEMVQAGSRRIRPAGRRPGAPDSRAGPTPTPPLTSAWVASMLGVVSTGVTGTVCGPAAAVRTRRAVLPLVADAM